MNINLSNGSIIAIILARGGSKGIKNKNIINFCGEPLIGWSIKQAKHSNYIDKVYVSTEDQTIASIAKNYGADIIWRPIDLASDTATSEDGLEHALRQIEIQTNVDTVAFLQATSPIRTAVDIDNAIGIFNLNGFDSLFSMACLDDFCIWNRNKNELNSISYDYLHRGRRQEKAPLYLENGSIYLFKPTVLYKYKNRLGGKIGMYEMPFERSYEIDTLEDVPICEYFMKRMLEGF